MNTQSAAHSILWIQHGFVAAKKITKTVLRHSSKLRESILHITSIKRGVDTLEEYIQNAGHDKGSVISISPHYRRTTECETTDNAADVLRWVIVYRSEQEGQSPNVVPPKVRLMVGKD